MTPSISMKLVRGILTAATPFAMDQQTLFSRAGIDTRLLADIDARMT
jgi:hypothetical protein